MKKIVVSSEIFVTVVALAIVAIELISLNGFKANGKTQIEMVF